VANVKTILCRGWYHPQGKLCEKTIKTMSIKSIAALAASPFLFAGAAFAGPYVNIETNSSFTGSDYTSTATDLAIGYQGANWWVQGGPIVTSPDNGDSTTDLLVKAGGNVAFTDVVGAYGEVSFQTADNADSAYGVKIGARYSF
tara:strand:+ start:880 stop:1311 length:432 start_codon:yes stop_codon:yes gene_type:complete